MVPQNNINENALYLTATRYIQKVYVKNLTKMTTVFYFLIEV